MTRPPPAPIVRDMQELRSILLGLPWVRELSDADLALHHEDQVRPQDVFENEPGFTPGLSKERMKP